MSENAQEKPHHLDQPWNSILFSPSTGSPTHQTLALWASTMESPQDFSLRRDLAYDPHGANWEVLAGDGDGKERPKPYIRSLQDETCSRQGPRNTFYAPTIHGEHPGAPTSVPIDMSYDRLGGALHVQDSEVPIGSGSSTMDFSSSFEDYNNAFNASLLVASLSKSRVMTEASFTQGLVANGPQWPASFMQLSQLTLTGRQRLCRCPPKAFIAAGAGV
ncbi:hypothetical protein PQX77_000537 [Marasmius sp. AFHP31]|nr:hypothetical protein PQX77_000537 [Marasmius sp. AFHP31]